MKTIGVIQPLVPQVCASLGYGKRHMACIANKVSSEQRVMIAFHYRFLRRLTMHLTNDNLVLLKDVALHENFAQIMYNLLLRLSRGLAQTEQLSRK